MKVEILYVVSVRMSGKIILEDQRVGQNGLGGNHGPLFLCRKRPIKQISVKVTLIVTDSQFIDNIASTDGIKRRLVT